LVFCLDIETLISEFYATLFIQIRIGIANWMRIFLWHEQKSSRRNKQSF